ncbi:MAG: chemotaxis protein CheW [Deltaproteobacteria bacterium]|nr:chemotaxis protein CheW [Deltaproteobacteria bacterium]
MSIQDDETLRLYVEESIEHLADIENDLLAIESAGADINEELVNKVFRAAHSIKGGAGFMGLNNIKELSHKMENVLGMIREREMVPNSEIINILLLASDTLRNLLDNVEDSNSMDIDDHVNALINLTTNAAPEQAVKKQDNNIDIIFDSGRMVFTVSASDLASSRKKGQFIYLAVFDLVEDVDKKGLRVTELIKRLSESGTILSTGVDAQSVGTLEDFSASNKLPFMVLFGTILEPEMINALFDVAEENIYLLGNDNTFKHLGEDTFVDNTYEEKYVEEQVNEPYVKTPEEEHEYEETSVHSSPETASDSSIIKDNESAGAPGSKIGDTSLRVNVSLLDSLMTLAGELVLGRNQLLQAIGQKDLRSIDGTGQRLDLITSEIQEAIMMTRMQPIGNVLNKFPRVVRDLARNLNKDIRLTIEGEGVELDKTILEAINDPLTHLVRNSVDHGIERPAERQKAGKNPVGQVFLKAYHEAGQVNIEIRDDGKGINPDKLTRIALEKNLITEDQAISMSEKEKINLIFLPGFSTAERVSDVSGRGVGMDVVKTNLDKLGGVVDIDSSIGKGTTIKIKLPLTLAIIPSQLISVCGERYAIPQVNLEELFRIPANQVKERIEKVGDAEVVRLRGNLLPLIRLADVIGIERTFVDPDDNFEKKDRRENIADRRGKKSPVKKGKKDDNEIIKKINKEDEEHIDQDVTDGINERREVSDRRYHATSAVNIVVVYTGALKYGLVVDELFDSEEIVVKPLGRHLKHTKAYAGATIMGDGRVALILDVAGISQMANLTSIDGTERAVQVAKEQRLKNQQDIQSLLIFRNAEDEQFAVPLGLVERVEKIKRSSIEHVGGKNVIQYRGASLPLFAIEQVADVKPLADKEDLLVIVFSIGGRDIGLLATPPLDATEEALKIDDMTLKQTGIMGSAIIGNQTTLMVNIFGIVEALNPNWFDKKETVMITDDRAATVLYAEDSNFFRSQVMEYLKEDGYNVLEAEDGVVAFDLIEKHIDEISLIITDIEMPNMDGFELTARIRGDERYKHLPVIALTTMASEDDITRGRAVGIDDYQIKLDKDKLMKSVYQHLKRGRQ